MHRWSLVCVMGLLSHVLCISPSAAASPSFDCQQADGFVEKLICSDSELAANDVQMAQRYAEAVKRATGAAKKQLIEEQRRWITGRNGCERATEPRKSCVADYSQQRISRLELLLNAYKESLAKPRPNVISYLCEDNSQLVLRASDADWAVLEGGGTQWKLPHVPSGSGAKYEKDGALFWSHGDEAIFEQHGKSTNCRVVQTKAPAGSKRP